MHYDWSTFVVSTLDVLRLEYICGETTLYYQVTSPLLWSLFDILLKILHLLKKDDISIAFLFKPRQ